MDKLIKAANDFYNGRIPELSDFEYDQLLKERKSNEPSFNIFDHIIYENDSSKAVHPMTIPVFEKRSDMQQIFDYLKEGIIATPKYDGSSIVAYYDKEGCLQNILTRSNEVEGVVQTEKLKNKVPATVNPEIKAILFEAIVREGRQKANGLINSKYKQEEVDELLELQPFDCILRSRVLGYKTRMDMTGLKYRVVSIDEISNMIGVEDEPKIDGIPIDGFVLYGEYEPTFAIIFKYYFTTARGSVITNIEWRMADTGVIHPVVQFNSVKIGTSNLKQCSVGSYQLMCQKKLGIGSQVKVVLAKMTIPQISENTSWKEKPNPVCPVCGSLLQGYGKDLICSNINCNFWDNFFMDRIFTHFESFMGKEWVDEFTTVNPYTLSTLKKAIKVTEFDFASYLRKTANMFDILKPLRLSGKTYDEKRERVLTLLQEYYDSYVETAKNLIYQGGFTGSQYDYMIILFTRFKAFLARYKETT